MICANEDSHGFCTLNADDALKNNGDVCLAIYDECPYFESGDEESLLSFTEEGDDDIDF